MGLAKRIIPCLDVIGNTTVKGVNFSGMVPLGSPVEMATLYCRQGADELVFLDIEASVKNTGTIFKVIEEVAGVVDVPFTVGGGISEIGHVEKLMESGADKISLNSAALLRPSLISDIARRFGSQCVVVAVDYMLLNGTPMVMSHGGKKKTDRKLIQWVKEIIDSGAGEILLTAIDRDGTGAGFDIENVSRISGLAGIPVIASGGAGSPVDFLDVFTRGNADAALAAGIFHRNELKISELKEFLKDNNLEIRL